MQLIATSALFLAAKSEETPRPLYTVIKAAYEIGLKHNLSCFPYYLPVVSIFYNFTYYPNEESENFFNHLFNFVAWQGQDSSMLIK